MKTQDWDDAYNKEPSLTVAQHDRSLRALRAKLGEESLRRADRVSYETKGLTMPIRLRVAREFLLPPLSGFPSEAWDHAFDERMQELFKT